MISLATRTAPAAAFSAAFAFALAGCSVPPRPPAPAALTRPAAPASLPTASAAPVLPIDPAQSTLRLLVFRAGALARLGHDHVIEGRGLSGWIDPNARGNQPAFDLLIPVEAFDVDPDAARAEEGPQFAEQISAEAKAGTRHNMLGEALLDAARFAQIEVRASAADVAASTATSLPEPAEGTEAPRTALLTVLIAGHESRQPVEFQLLRGEGRWIVNANFELRQSALGLTPFSVMMGALQVQDEMHVRVHLVAHR